MGTFSNIASIFSDIANSLRSKMGSQDTFTPSQMAPAINNIPTGIVPFDDVNCMYVSGVNDVAIEVEQYNNPIVNASELFAFNYNMIYDKYYIGYSVFDISGCFSSSNFNKPVIINSRQGMFNMSGCFQMSPEFNQPVTFINTRVYDMSYCFGVCTNFNQPITIPDDVYNMYACFTGCSKFNQPITIPNEIGNMASCFSDCSNFNQPITIPDKSRAVINMARCFSGCTNLNQPIIFGSGVNNVAMCLYNCVNFNSSLYFNNSSKLNRITTNKLLGGTNNSLIKSIYCNNATPFTNTKAASSIVGEAVTWTAMSDGNGYYNTFWKVNIYNNWTP